MTGRLVRAHTAAAARAPDPIPAQGPHLLSTAVSDIRVASQGVGAPVQGAPASTKRVTPYAYGAVASASSAFSYIRSRRASLCLQQKRSTT